jgi:hypothetical protein
MENKKLHFRKSLPITRNPNGLIINLSCAVTSFFEKFFDPPSYLTIRCEWERLEIVTLAAIRKMVFTLPKAQRVRLADEMLEDSIVPFREPVTLAILERRAEELRSGKVKGVGNQEFEATLKELEAGVEAFPRGARSNEAVNRGLRTQGHGRSSHSRPRKKRSS